jgi:ABC-type lipoprotein release transport system permease subunit
MNTAKIAWRNLWRRKRRTLITAFSVGFGIALFVTFTGMGDYSYTQIIDSGATMGFGHVTVEARGYNDSPALDQKIAGTPDILEAVGRIPGVRDAVVRITGQAMFATAAKSVGGMFLAVDPSRETEEANVFMRMMVKGSVFKDAGARHAVIGIKMAEKLNLDLGKKLVATFTDAEGEIVSEIARVTGIFETGVQEVDGGVVLLPIDRIRDTLRYRRDEATMVSILVGDQRESGVVKDRIIAELGRQDIEVLTWHETRADLAGIIAVDRAGNYLFQVLVGLLIGAGILNTMLMSVLERVREFGVMMAIGLSPGRLIRMVLMEAVWIGLIGLVMGIVVFSPWYAYMILKGIDFSSWIGEGYSAGGAIVDPVMKLRLYRESAVVILAGIFSLTLAAAVYPAVRASRVAPVESLKAL